MSLPKQEIEYMNNSNSTETRVALVEQAISHLSTLMHDVKNEVKEGRKENKEFRFEMKEEHNKIWNKVENLDQRINNNYTYLDNKIDTRFSDIEKKITTNFKLLLTTILGLYATIFGGMIAKFLNFM